jgi:Coiled-coil domain-containing protein 124 /Oxs1
LSQYKERVYNLWKKSPENPANQPTPPTAAS